MTITELPRRLRDAVPTMARPTRRPDGAASPPDASGTGIRRGLAAMRHANYRRYWFGQIGSLIGVWMQSVALPWLVLQLGGSPLQLGLVMAFLFGPVDDRRAARRRPRGSRRQAADADHRQRRGDAPGIGPVRPDRDGRHRDLADLRPGAGCRHRRLDRDAAAPGVRRGARAARGPRQRDRPQLDVVQPVTRHRSGDRRAVDRHARRCQQLRNQRR